MDSSPESNLPYCPMLQQRRMDYEDSSDVPAGRDGIHFGTDSEAYIFILLTNETMPANASILCSCAGLQANSISDDSYLQRLN